MIKDLLELIEEIHKDAGLDPKRVDVGFRFRVYEGEYRMAFITVLAPELLDNGPVIFEKSKIDRFIVDFGVETCLTKDPLGTALKYFRHLRDKPGERVNI